MVELAFVLARGQHGSAFQLVAAVRDELDELGVPSSVTVGPPPEASADRILVFPSPHEYAALEGDDAIPPPRVLARSILLERPRIAHTDRDLGLTQSAGAVFGLNPSSPELFASRGIAAEAFPVGYAARWDRFDPDRLRDVDVVFLDDYSERRAGVLARAAPLLAHRVCRLQFSDNLRPRADTSLSRLIDSRLDLLGRAKVVLSVHRGEEPEFEWLQAAEAFHTGAVLVAERSSGTAPLVAGSDFVSGREASLAVLVEGLLNDGDRLERLRRTAYETIRARLPLRDAVRRLVAAGRRLAALPFPVASREVRRPVRAIDRLEPVRAALKDARPDRLGPCARAQRLEPSGAGPRVRHVAATSAWRAAPRARISVLVAVGNNRDHVARALDSLLTSRLRSLEIVVVDDGSNDGSSDAGREWQGRHDGVAVLHLCLSEKRGLRATRNTALDFARAQYCFVLDASSEIYSRCLPALVGALDDVPEAAFAYPILEAVGRVDAYLARGGALLLNACPWEPGREPSERHAGTLTLLRTDAVREVGGYATDRRLFGWEDHDLWCRLARRVGHGVHVPQILGRHWVSPAT